MTQEKKALALSIITGSGVQSTVSFNVNVKPEPLEDYEYNEEIMITQCYHTVIRQLIENGFTLNLTNLGLAVNHQG